MVRSSNHQEVLLQSLKKNMKGDPNQTHRFQDDNRYHAFDEGICYLPNDETEASRLGEKGCDFGLLAS